MLLNLKIKNIAVIEEANIEFFDGLNVLTGETGAGKSILIDSISMLIGMRSNKELIRTGEEKASVYGVFKPCEKVWKILAAEGIEPSEDGLLSVSREMNISGKSVCRIGGQVQPLSLLKKIGSSLINIHGQHDWAELYDPEKHIFLLDKWCGKELSALVADYRESYKKYIEVVKENKRLSELSKERDRQIDYLEYEIKEITEAEIRVGEEKELADRKAALMNAEKISKAVSDAKESLFEGDFNARERVDIALIKLESLSRFDERLQKGADSLKEVLSLMDDARGIFRGIQTDMETEENLSYITDRLDIIQKMKRKYGADEQEILDHLALSQKKLAELNEAVLRQEKLGEEMSQLRSCMVEKAEKLSETRKIAGEKLSGEIIKQLDELNMPDCEFVVDIKKIPYGGLGADGVEFLISPNRGEEVKALSKIASGGELSRIMLAIKCIMAQTDDAGTYIFDEIDSGVSGRAAESVAGKLKMVGEMKQTLVISHLAHIAAAGKHHFLIEKAVEEGRTKTHITLLDRQGRILEIARINSGSNLSKTALDQAAEMLK